MRAWSIELLETLIGASPVAFAADDFGRVANPTVPCRLREQMHQLAELLFERDGSYPRWWRAIGENPDQAWQDASDSGFARKERCRWDCLMGR